MFPILAAFALARVLVGGFRRQPAAVHLPGDALVFGLPFLLLPFA